VAFKKTEPTARGPVLSVQFKFARKTDFELHRGREERKPTSLPFLRLEQASSAAPHPLIVIPAEPVD
jgi:hypothetical protein